jgi:macrodomain Ter protein organizer (MatP/YcbG family)
MSRPKLNERRASTFVPYSVFDKLKDLAQKKGLTVSSLLRMLILEYLDKQAKQKKKD